MNPSTLTPGKLFLIPCSLGAEDRLLLPADEWIRIVHIRHFVAERAKTARRFLKFLTLRIQAEAESAAAGGGGFDQGRLHIEEFPRQGETAGWLTLLEPAMQGEDMGILSEAGCPGIADPGAELVLMSHQKGIRVVPLVGPCSFLLALMGSGLNGQAYQFHGYLPVHEKERKRALKNLESLSAKTGASQIFMETPYRCPQMFKSILEVCESETMFCIASGLTGKEERIMTRSIRDWKGAKPELARAETVFILQA